MKNLSKKIAGYLKGNNRLLVFTLSFLLLFSVGSYALAAALYHPSDNELDPTCSPGDADCYVDPIPALTSGSVIFYDSGNLVEDNLNFSYDSTSHRLSLGGAIVSPGIFNIKTLVAGDSIVLKSSFTDVTDSIVNGLRFVDGWGSEWVFHQQPNNTNNFYLSNGSSRVVAFSAIDGVSIMQPGGGTLDPTSILRLTNTNILGSGSKALNILPTGGLPNGGTYTGIFLNSNITYTDGVGTTLLMDLRHANISRFKVGADGSLTTTGPLFLTGISSSVGTDYLCYDSATKSVTSGVSCGVSSERFKHDIATLDGNLDKVMRLRPVSYDLNTNGAHNIGFIAEEVSAIEPRVVIYETDGITPHSLNYAQFAPLLAGAIKELGLKVQAIELGTGQGGSVASIVGGYLRDAVVSITEATIGTLHIGNKICADDVCVTKDQFKTLLLQANGQGSQNQPQPPVTPPSEPTGDQPATPPADPTPPADTPSDPAPAQ